MTGIRVGCEEVNDRSRPGPFQGENEQCLRHTSSGRPEPPQPSMSQDDFSLSAPGPWHGQQLADGMPIDLQTSTLNTLTDAGMDWDCPLTQLDTIPMATPAITNLAFQDQTLPRTLPSGSRNPPSQARPLMGNSVAYPLIPLPSRQHHQNDGLTVSNLDEILPRSPASRRSLVPTLRAMQSVSSLSNTPDAPSVRRKSSGETGSSAAAKRTVDEDDAHEASDADIDDHTDDKMKISRERNRIAAAKTRKKKNQLAKDIEDRAKEIEQTNARLHQEMRVLRDTYSSLRYCALSHDPSAGCTCTGIHRYNDRMAKEVANEVVKEAETMSIRKI